MTKPNSTEVIVVLDRSGSMNVIKNDMEGAFNSFIEEQRLDPAECFVTLVTFDNEYDVVYERKPLSDVPKLKLNPSGSTALLGALGKTIDDVGKRFVSTPDNERPDKVLVVIITDGEENSSHTLDWAVRYSSHNEVMNMVKHQTEKYSWQFVYLGANQDAIKVGNQIGIAQAYNFNATSGGTKDMMNSVSRGVASYRSNGKYSA